MSKIKKEEVEIHELILDMLSRAFNSKEKTLIVKIKKDNLEIYGEYKSDIFFLCKLHGTTFGINERGKMPPKIKFSIEENKYNIELNMKNEGKEGTVVFTETRNEKNFISLNIY